MQINSDVSRGEKSLSGHLDWVDFARGICIILVVMMHFHTVYFDHLAVSELSKKISDAVVSAARPARMPTFFFISGFLASRALDRSWRDAFDGRIGLIYWVYLIWSIIATFTLFALYESATVENLRRFLVQIATQAVFARQSTWFLYGLVVFFIAARLLRQWPRIFIIVAVVASAFSEFITDMVTSEMIRTLPYFLLGIYFPALFLRAAGEPSIKRSVFLLALYGIAVVPVLVNRSIPGVWIPATLLGVTLVLSISRLLQASFPIPVLRYIGRNTLPIYVMHIPLLLIMRETTRDEIRLVFPQGLVFSVFGNIALVCWCLALAFILKRLGMGMLFNLPKRLRVVRHSVIESGSAVREQNYTQKHTGAA